MHLGPQRLLALVLNWLQLRATALAPRLLAVQLSATAPAPRFGDHALCISPAVGPHWAGSPALAKSTCICFGSGYFDRCLWEFQYAHALPFERQSRCIVDLH